ncbi:serine/threonine-protein kinase BLUS1-like [Impatiens glandulifera]|uniref:serine/threonine-protein kinase BLUS1-like n=1 Tax=Impatiens glandulifera TaxID=253017 RepID=UPI001FB0A00B|nr:serine/threonine-protein kinase BLUS1-like [Impatiens glandulifera]
MDKGENQEHNYPVDANSYTIIEVIGRGTNTIIYRAFCDPMNTNVVIKSIKFDKSNNSLTLSHLDSTIPAPPVLNHPNILNSHCTFLAAENLVWVVMPLMSVGSLQSIMSCSFPTGLPEEYIAIFLKPIFNLLSYLQQMESPDIELKAGNILLDHDGTFKFSDFGLWLSSQQLMRNVTAKSYWVAPELIESSDAYSVKSNIWSFGILALELAHGKPPLYDFPLSKSMIKKMKQRFSFWKFDENSTEKTFSETFKNLVKSCLKRNPAKRPTLNMLQNHPFFEKCKSTYYLVDKILKDLPPIVNRFELYTEIRGEEKDDDDEEVNVVSGWKLNADILKLFPFCSNEIQVEEEDEDEYCDYAKLEAVNAELHKVIKQLDVVCWTSSRTDYLETLFTVKTRLQEQLNRITSLFNSRGGVLFEVPFYNPPRAEQNGKEDNA